MKARINSTKLLFFTTVRSFCNTKRLILVICITLFSAACKKEGYKGTYAGTEDLLLVGTADTLTSSFAQAVSIDFSANVCVYTSSTLLWEFEKNQRTKNGFFHEKANTFFYIEFKGDSLIASYLNGDSNSNYTRRIFRGSK